MVGCATVTVTRFTILLADDSADDALLLRRAFGAAGTGSFLEVLGNGEQVVEYFRGAGAYSDRRKHPIPDLLILDLRMPRKSGLEALEELRRLKATLPTRIAVLTSLAQAADILRAHDLGVHFFGCKQANLKPFVERMERVILQAGSESPTSATREPLIERP